MLNGLEFVLSVVDRGDGSGVGTIVGDRRVIRLPKTFDEVIEAFDVSPGRLAALGRPGRDQLFPVLLDLGLVHQNQLVRLPPPLERLLVRGGVVMLEHVPHVVDIHEVETVPVFAGSAAIVERHQDSAFSSNAACTSESLAREKASAPRYLALISSADVAN